MPLELGDPVVAARPGRDQDLQRLGRRQGVVDVAEIHQPDDLLRRHVGQQPPDRPPGQLRGEIPGRIDDCPDRHVHDALFRAEPSQLAVIDQGGTETAQVRGDVGYAAAHHVRPKGLDGGDDHLVAAPDREAERMAFKPVGVGAQDRVGGRVIGIGVHRIRPVVLDVRREAHVEAVQSDDPRAIATIRVRIAARRRNRGGVLWLDVGHNGSLR